MLSDLQLKSFTQNKGSELLIEEQEVTELDSLPIDFARLSITMDANGKVSLADKEQSKQVEQVVDIYYGRNQSRELHNSK